MGTFQEISWEVAYETGILVIDGQHRKLFELYNAFVRSHTENTSVNRAETLQELFDYTQTHFKYEERVMRVFEYADVESHVAEHRRFAEKVSSLKTEYAHAESSDTDVKLAQFLKEWLIDHIMEFDKRYCDAIPSDAE